ncbi:hypothetical protein F5890DRAFT_1411020 [Lentinula detonsa]|uniref:DDE-1 domain-containing protein n=1 Tax=Lentinula detonsa TaxID=2804962 RepID=A0AA38USA7_9AGAR|nr:hypothetical protein F5890DRAFT_1411020 [Lentinula detonsa]
MQLDNIAPPKRRKLNPDQIQSAFADITQHLKSAKSKPHAGSEGLEARRARAIQSTLHSMVNNRSSFVYASCIAAEAAMFAKDWGSRLVRRWVRDWINVRSLPQSNRGRHSKINSVLSDSTAREAIRTYLRSNKWALNPQKLEQLMKGELVSEEASEYRREIEHNEMPRGLKVFIEEKVLPRLHVKPASSLGLSLSSMRCNLVLVAHDEMVAQAHDGLKYTWVLNGEQPLRKKGVGRGLHQSDFICSTVGWLEKASVTIEYGKNHDGMWTGELFAKQIQEKFFKAFADAHGPGHIAVILVDNSQGHSSYAPDALRASGMNLKPGGKQARMHAGWYMRDGQKIIQPMIYGPDHEMYSNQAKGMKARWLREHCDYTFSTLQKNMQRALRSVPVQVIRKWEHRTWRFIDAYAANLDAKDALLKVKQFSSQKYKSHRRVPERLVQAMDQA